MDYASFRGLAIQASADATAQVDRITQQLVEGYDSPELFLPQLVRQIARRKVWAQIAAAVTGLDSTEWSDERREGVVRQLIATRVVAAASTVIETDLLRAERVVWSHAATTIGL